MTDLGSYFRRKREENEISLEEVARETYIASRYLKAIENDDFDQFPAHVYAKGFIRIYADYLDLDAESLVTEYTLNVEENNEPSSEAVGDEEDGYSLLYWGTLGLILLTALALVLLRFAWTHPGPDRRAYQNAGGSSETGRMHGIGDYYTLAFQGRPDRLSLRVVARQKTWIYAVFDGIRNREIMLRPGEERTWEAEDTIRLRVDNAGALRLFFQGRALPPLGPPGEATDKVITLGEDALTVKTAGVQPTDQQRRDTVH